MEGLGVDGDEGAGVRGCGMQGGRVVMVGRMGSVGWGEVGMGGRKPTTRKQPARSLAAARLLLLDPCPSDLPRSANSQEWVVAGPHEHNRRIRSSSGRARLM